MSDSKVAKRLKNAEIALRREQSKQRPDPKAIARAEKELLAAQEEKRIHQYQHNRF